MQGALPILQFRSEEAEENPRRRWRLFDLSSGQASAAREASALSEQGRLGPNVPTLVGLARRAVPVLAMADVAREHAAYGQF